MNKEVKRYVPEYCEPGGEIWAEMQEDNEGGWVCATDYDAILAERDALRNSLGSMRNALKNARYRIEQGRVWNGMGWTLTGLSSNSQQKALDEINAALQGERP